MEERAGVGGGNDTRTGGGGETTGAGRPDSTRGGQQSGAGTRNIFEQGGIAPAGGRASASAGAWHSGEVLDLGGAAPECSSHEAGAAGQPEGGGPELGGCFEALDNGLRCESAGAHAQGPGFERVCAATNLTECKAACLERPDCVAVSDYFNVRPFDLCAFSTGTCQAPAPTEWGEEDAGKEYIKVCPAGEVCHFEYLGDWIRCEDDPSGKSDTRSTSLQACAAACLESSSCTSITDYFYLGRSAGCYLYTGACDASRPLPAEDLGKTYVRRPCSAD